MSEYIFEIAREKLETIKLGISNKEYTGFRGYNDTDGWGGGGLLVTTEKPQAQSPGFYPDPRTIVTPHAHEVGWLVTKLWDLFAENNLVDHCSKIEFFGRLEVAAQRYLNAVVSKSEIVSGILYAIFGEARQILYEMQQGEFNSLIVAVGNDIATDIAKYSEDEFSRYFAYGSNMDMQQMQSRCPGSTLIGNAILANHRFIINTRGVATVIYSPDHVVHGLVWKITNDHEASLDQNEGVQFGTYTKQCIPLLCSDNCTKYALAYVASNDKTGHAAKNGYLEMILRALHLNAMPRNYIDEISSNWR